MTSKFAANDTEGLPKRLTRRAEKIAAVKLSQAMGGTGLLDRRAPSLQDFSTGFLNWVESVVLTRKSKKFYCNGWRLLSKTHIGACAWIT